MNFDRRELGGSTRGLRKRTTTSSQPPLEKGQPEIPEELGEDGLGNLSRLFDKSLLAELISENALMDRTRRVVEGKHKQGFKLMGPHTNPQWNKIALLEDCLKLDNRLAIPIELRPAAI